MTATVPDSSFRPEHKTGGTVKASLDLLETLFEKLANDPSDADCLEEVGPQLRGLHALIRSHHAADLVRSAEGTGDALPPELTEELGRLRSEHQLFLGILDRLIRSADSMVERPLEDKEVFVLRGRELIAMLRRHEAEEDRLFHIALWRDTGGES